MPAAVLALMLLAAPDRADSDVRLPVVDVRKAVASGRAVLTISLTRHGQIWVHRRAAARGKLDNAIDDYLDEPKLQSMTLDELATHLFASRRMHGLQRKIDKAQGKDPAPFTIDIRADREAPWGHVLWILTVCAKERCHTLRLAAMRADKTPVLLDASLPIDRFVKNEEEPVHRLPVVVSLLAADEGEAAWGPPNAVRKVLLTKRVRFGYGNRWYDWKAGWGKPTGKQAVERWLQAARRLATDPSLVLRGEIRASEKVPIQYVASVLALFRSAGYQHVGFHGTELPPKVRKARLLPYPVRNEIPDTEPQPDMGIEDD